MIGSADISKRKKFFGKFRGVVVNNIDPLMTGRLLVQVPDVLGSDPCIWAESASPLTGSGMGLYMVPPIDSGVWIEFQQGDTDFAMWTGCWRGSQKDVPTLAMASPPAIPPIVLGTEGQNAIVISDVPGPTGGITISSSSGAFISISQAGIFISNGSGAVINMKGPVVDINSGTLRVLGP